MKTFSAHQKENMNKGNKGEDIQLRKIKQWVPAQSVEKYLTLRKAQFELRKKAEELARSENQRCTYMSRIHYDMVQKDIRLKFRWSNRESWTDCNLGGEGYRVPFINLDKITSYENKEPKKKDTRGRVPLVKPEKGMQPPRGRERNEKSRSRSRHSNFRKPNKAATKPVVPAHAGQSSSGSAPGAKPAALKAGTGRETLPMPSLPIINQRLKDNQKQANIDDILQSGQGGVMAEVEDITGDMETEEPAVPQPQRKSIKGRRTNLEKAWSMNNNTILQTFQAQLKNSAAKNTETPTGVKGQKRLPTSGEKSLSLIHI